MIKHDAALPAGRRQPGPARGPSARAYLLIMLGEYILADEGAGAWTQTITDGLALLGFEERAARQARTPTAAPSSCSPR